MAFPRAQAELIARKIKRDPDRVVEDAELIRIFHSTAEFAAALCSKGEGWLFPGVPLAQFQRDALQSLDDGSIEKRLDLWPRGHMKTTLFSKIGPIKRALYGEPYQVVFSATDKNRRGIVQSHRSLIQDRYLFPELHYLLPYWFADCRNPNDPNEWIVKANENELVLANGARIDYLSMGSENRGLNASGRPSWIELDDILPSDAATSDAERERVTNTFFSVIRPLGRMGARFHASGTILHKDDLWCQIAEGRIPGWSVSRLKAHNDNFSSVLWPQRWTGEAFRRIKQEYESSGRAHLYAREYLNDPATAATHPFGQIPFTREFADGTPMYRVIAIDHSQGVGLDDFVICETGHDWQDKIHVLSVFAKNTISLPQRLEAATAAIQFRRPHRVVIEDTTESRTFIEALELHLRNLKQPIHILIERPKATVKKNARIVDWLVPRYHHGGINHALPRDQADKLEGQLRSFDVTTDRNADDWIDALARAVEYSRKAEAPEQFPRPTEPRLAVIHDAMRPPRKLPGDEYPTWK